MSYQVKSALVITKNEDGSDLYLYAGALVPARIKGPELARLIEGGFVADLTPAEPEDETPVRPPEAGAGSSKAAWIEYAAAVGVTHDADVTRDVLVAALDAAGF